MKHVYNWLFVLMVIIKSSISLSCDDNPFEEFKEADIPVFVLTGTYKGAGSYYLCEPWNYNKSFNKNRKYPLVVYLHGSGGNNSPGSYSFIGGYAPTETPGETARSFLKTYPSFVYLPYTSGGWDSTILISQIEELITNYRIDNNRLYIIGYSMGGYGSCTLSQAYYNNTPSRLFAGIIRLAGQGSATVPDPIADKTSVWLHIGLEENADDIDRIRNAYDFLKNYHPTAIEVKTDVLKATGQNGTTYSLIKNNIDIVKRTEYNNVEHDVNYFPFKDSYLLKWLFYQSLQKR